MAVYIYMNYYSMPMLTRLDRKYCHRNANRLTFATRLRNIIEMYINVVQLNRPTLKKKKIPFIPFGSAS